ncbi:hypothetical protein ACFSO7_02520 [Bacillus sp. CGMCC 1.16607]|uniref:hypothetical protein n=1 Tax=Bacillus sp. CGMCC 1.16607 TaxID=3351842 RepID=UPI00363D77A0
MKKMNRKLIAATVLSMLAISQISATAATQETIFTVKGDQSTVPGIYSSVPNGKSKLVIKDSVYELKEVDKLGKLMGGFFYTNDRPATAEDYKKQDMFTRNVRPLQDVQAVGKELYYTKFLGMSMYMGGSCGGGGAEILEIYKRNSAGKVMKVTPDWISSNTVESFEVVGANIYYARIENSEMGKFTVIKASIDGKKKNAILSAVDDFWVEKDSIYFIKDKKLFKSGLDGKGAKQLTKLVSKLYGASVCDGSNYQVVKSGLVVNDYEKDASVYYDFATNTTVNTPTKINLVYDVDLKRKLIVGANYDEESLSLYDFNGKIVKDLKVDVSWESGATIVSVDSANRKIQYVKGNSLKEIQY